MNFWTELVQVFKLPTPLQVAVKELAAAELELLKAETGVEYASSAVFFNRAQIKRLRAYISAKTVEVTE